MSSVSSCTGATAAAAAAMMMTSTFPTSKNNGRNIKYGLKEIQLKKESLLKLEAALKKRINEFRELCLKEGELTGHLPADYPLQPREPIPQVRRRLTRSSGNISENFAAPSTIKPPPSAQNILVQRPNGVTNHYQPYYEETKPFQMSDFYKYSSKHRTQAHYQPQPQPKPQQHQQHQEHQQPPPRPPPPASTIINSQVKTTRQLQEDVSKAKNTLKFAACDDQIQQSVRLIERSGQKLIQATANAISGNPSLAERLNNILINNNNHHHHHHHRNGERY